MVDGAPQIIYHPLFYQFTAAVCMYCNLYCNL